MGSKGIRALATASAFVIVLTVALAILTFAGSIDPCYAQEDTTACPNSPEVVKSMEAGTAKMVTRTDAYLQRHPRATHLLEKIDMVEVDGYLDLTVDSSWRAYYVVTQFGGGQTDGAYYYDSTTKIYGACGKRYLRYTWAKVTPEHRSALCPRALSTQVDAEVLAPR